MSSNKIIIIGIFSITLVAGVLFADVAEAVEKPRILIVPGHEPTYGGAEFGSIKERDLAAELGQNLKEFLESDGDYEVFMTRDSKAWDDTFADYFKENWKKIIAWGKTAKKDMSYKIEPTIIHNDAESDVGTRLYGITKWSNENEINLMVHVHINDDPLHSRKVPGKFSGMAIYVPPKQYSNGTFSRAVAESLFKVLSKKNPVSDWKQESGGIIESPELIALGANDTSLAGSVLIEYDYLYAPRFTDPKIRGIALKELAYDTYLGLEDFFEKGLDLADGYQGISLPYLWLGPVTPSSPSTDIYALQTTLSAIGEYPPAGKTKNDCPRSGVFGPCTRNALSAFQKKYGISSEKGVAGEETLFILHSNGANDDIEYVYEKERQI